LCAFTRCDLVLLVSQHGPRRCCVATAGATPPRPEPKSVCSGTAERPIHRRRTSAAIRRRARRPTSVTGPRRGRGRPPGTPNPPRCDPRGSAAHPETQENRRKRPSEPPNPGRCNSARCHLSRGPAAAWMSGLEEVPAKATLPPAGSSVAGRGPGWLDEVQGRRSGGRSLQPFAARQAPGALTRRLTAAQTATPRGPRATRRTPARTSLLLRDSVTRGWTGVGAAEIEGRTDDLRVRSACDSGRPNAVRNGRQRAASHRHAGGEAGR
jgi:hypothetical protein